MKGEERNFVRLGKIGESKKYKENGNILGNRGYQWYRDQRKDKGILGN